MGIKMNSQNVEYLYKTFCIYKYFVIEIVQLQFDVSFKFVFQTFSIASHNKRRDTRNNESYFIVMGDYRVIKLILVLYE